MERVTTGIARTVFLVGRWAVKVPCGRYSWENWLRGLLANLQERRWSRMGLPELCPVVFSDPFGFVVVMPRVRPIGWVGDIETLYQHLRNIKHRTYGDYSLPVEIKEDSWGLFEGRVVAVDYGN